MIKDYLKLPIAVIGAGSMVGSRFCDLTRSELKLIEADINGQNPIDITSETSVEDFFANHKFDSVILFSAYTDVEGAEAQRNDKNGICWKINVDGVENIVNACQKYGRKLFFISTDFVFDGKNGPYNEENPTGKNPKDISWYGITKIEAEKFIQRNLTDAVIIRISYPFRGRFEGKDDILKRILKMAKVNKLYPMFADQKITPTFIDDLPGAFKTIIKKERNGIFHVSSPKITTQYELTKKTLSVFGFNNVKVEKGSLVDFLKSGGKTPRPINGGFNVAKISKLGFTPTSWDEGIKKVFDQTKGDLIR